MKELYDFICPNGVVDSQCLVYAYIFAVITQSVFGVIKGIICSAIKVAR